MCGRFTLTITRKEVARRFGTTGDGGPPLPRFNIAPMQMIAVVLPMQEGRYLRSMRWGFTRAGGGSPWINARSETLAERPAFRGRVGSGRCLVPADGFYEWTREGRGGRRQAYRFRLPDGQPFAMAGLWRPGEVNEVVLLTQPSSGRLAEIHARAPVCLRAEDESRWIDPSRPFPHARACLDCASCAGFVADPVGPAVHAVGIEGPVCVAPVAIPVQPNLL